MNASTSPRSTTPNGSARSAGLHTGELGSFGAGYGVRPMKNSSISHEPAVSSARIRRLARSFSPVKTI